VPATDRKRLYEGFRKYSAVTTIKKYAKAMMATEAGWTLEEELAEDFMYVPLEYCSKDNVQTDNCQLQNERANGLRYRLVGGTR
jgi:uncharacterized protein YgiB involved in biofilm formation